MAIQCETCNDLTGISHYRCSLKAVKESGKNGCDGCSLLVDAVEIWLKSCVPLPAESSSSTQELEICWQSSDRNIFTIEVTSNNGRTLPQLFLELHAAPGIASKWESIKSAGHVAHDSNSQECVAKIKDWLQSCRSDHPKCNSIKSEWAHRVPVPARRLIDVGSVTTEPRLVEENVIRSVYATLSHCWGSSHPLTTTKATLRQRLRSIPMQDLPSTFQDAVRLVRALGIRYIWIDSLCIVQDDDKDWEHEASRMGDIYGSSYLTIAATSAIDSSEGIFGLHPSSTQIPGTDIFVRQSIDHSVFHLPVVDALHEVNGEEQAHKYPLLTRGWCLQERLLSNRILHFTADEMVWQCRNCDRCECDGIRRLRNIRSSSQMTSRLKFNRVIEGSSGSDIWTIWREIVEDYCSTHLTKDSDHLPALSGVAAKFGLSGAGTYIAGLWHKPGALALGSSPMFLDLLWKSSTTTARRPAVKVAPSFSWASRIGPIRYRSEVRDRTRQYQSDARNAQRKYIDKLIFVLPFPQASKGLHRFSDSPDATLHLRCQLLPCTMKVDGHSAKIVLEQGGIYDITPDVAESILVDTDAEMFCMPVAAYGSDTEEVDLFDGLVLTKTSTATYRRVALAEGLPGRWIDDQDHETIVLI